jgi:hypothetical protein
MIAGLSSQLLCKLYHSFACFLLSNLGLTTSPLWFFQNQVEKPPSISSISCMKLLLPFFSFRFSVKVGALHQPQPVFPIPFATTFYQAHATSCINKSTGIVLSAPCSSSHSFFSSSFIKTQFVGKGSKPLIVSTTSCLNLTTPS